MIYWAPLLHFYQPPLQLAHVLRKVVNESYRPLTEVFSQYPHARVTVNINGVLTEMLAEGGYQDIIQAMKELAEKGQLEFTGSAKYHPILPLIPVDEMRRQIRRNAQTNRHFFGDVYRPRGFFPPELAYGPSLLQPVLESRHEWLIVSGIACPLAWPINAIHEAASNGDRLPVFFRDDILSNRISFHDIDGDGFAQHLREMGSGGGDAYVVTAMDAETFGHHIRHWEKLFLVEVYESLQPAALPEVALAQSRALAESHRGLLQMPLRQEPAEVAIVTISELLEHFPRGQALEPRPSSWSTTSEDLAAGNPYPLWKAPNNALHRLQWEHIDIAVTLVRQAEQLADNEASRQHTRIARALLDRALHSCQFWWASRRPMWDTNMVSRGLAQQREAVFNAFRSISLSGAEESVKRDAYYRVVAARDLGNKIHDRLFWD